MCYSYSYVLYIVYEKKKISEWNVKFVIWGGVQWPTLPKMASGLPIEMQVTYKVLKIYFYWFYDLFKYNYEKFS